jgi:hypothetical protein
VTEDVQGIDVRIDMTERQAEAILRDFVAEYPKLAGSGYRFSQVRRRDRVDAVRKIREALDQAREAEETLEGEEA